MNNVVGEMLIYAGRYDEAMEQYRKTLELDPNFAMALENLGRVYEQKGMASQAVAQFLKSRTLSRSGLVFAGWDRPSPGS